MDQIVDDDVGENINNEISHCRYLLWLFIDQVLYCYEIYYVLNM